MNLDLTNPISSRMRGILGFAALILVCLWGASSASAAGYNDYLELHIAHPAVPTGSEDAVSGKLTNLSGKPIHNGTVMVEYAYPGESAKPITEFKTGTSGTYAHMYKIPATVYFRAHFTGGGGFTPVTTKWLKVTTTSGIPANGTEYVEPKTGCVWVVENGAWVGKGCMSQEVDSTGKPIADMYNLYEFSATSSNHVGNYMAEVYTGDSTYLEYRLPNPVFGVVNWAAVPKSNPTAEAIWEVPIAGNWSWITTTQLKQMMGAQQAAAAGQAAAPPAADTITVPASVIDGGFTDFFNGIDKLGGNAELGETFSKLYSVGIEEPFTPGPCGEINYECW